MKRFVALLAVAGLVTALPLSHLVAQPPPPDEKGPPGKVLICHLTHTGVYVFPQDHEHYNNGEEYEALVGHVIEVSKKAEPAHCAHGDHNPTRPKGAECVRVVDDPRENFTYTCGGEPQETDPPWYGKRGK